MTPTKSYKELVVWQKAKDLAIEVYRFTEHFPKSELFGLTSQMRRAAVSVSSNIAESYNRFHRKEKDQFFAIAFGSCSELESQIEIAKVLFPNCSYKVADSLLLEIGKMLNTLLTRKFSDSSSQT